MIKAEELRIGNLVEYNNELNIVDEITFFPDHYGINGIVSHPVNVTGNKRRVVKDYHYHPIPLTAERLLEFGAISLVKLSDGYERYNLNGIQLSISPERDFFIEYVHQIPIRSVHVLQNFYFATRQEELTIKNQ